MLVMTSFLTCINKTTANPNNLTAVGSKHRNACKQSNDPHQILLHYSQELAQIAKLSADLDQRNPNGTRLTAKLYLERPGKMRLIYNKPSKIEIIATNGRLIYYDGQRDHSQSMALESSPVAFLLTGALHQQVKVVKIIRYPQSTVLVVSSKKDPNSGTIELTFNNAVAQKKHSCSLLGWCMKDAYGKATTITLVNVKKNGPMPKGAFELRKK